MIMSCEPEYLLIKVLHPTCLHMHEYFQMTPAVNIYAHEYPTTSKYHMLPNHFNSENLLLCHLQISHALKKNLEPFWKTAHFSLIIMFEKKMVPLTKVVPFNFFGSNFFFQCQKTTKYAQIFEILAVM